MIRTSLIALAALSTGCTMADRYAEVLPDDRVQVAFPEASNPEGSNAKAATDFAEWYLFTHQITRDLNGMTGLVLGMVDTIVTTYRPTWADRDRHLAQWGPWSEPLDPTETLMFVQYLPDTDEYRWGFDQWPKGAEDARVPVISGEIDAGATRDASSGRFEVDFETIHALDPTTDPDGGVFVTDYVIEPGYRNVVASFDNIEGTETDARYAYEQEDGAGGFMDLAVYGDVNPESGTGLQELWYVRSRWHADGSGRADVRLTGGDLGEQVITVSECWDSTFQQIYYQDNIGGATAGDATTCAFEVAVYSEL